MSVFDKSSLANLSVNEKRLIALALFLCVFIGGWQFLIKPVFTAKQKSTSQYSKAIRDYEIVQRAVPKLQLAVPQNSGAASFDRSAIIDTAAQVNIAISRVQPSSNGALQLWFDDVSSKQVYDFLQRLNTQYAVDVINAQITRRTDGLISAQFTFSPINANDS